VFHVRLPSIEWLTFFDDGCEREQTSGRHMNHKVVASDEKAISSFQHWIPGYRTAWSCFLSLHQLLRVGGRGNAQVSANYDLLSYINF
jgi:hypothetical protein